MKVVVIGKGKTGQEVSKLVEENQLIGSFDSENKVTVDDLKKADVAIVFVPASGALEISQLIFEAKTHAVWGTTGYQWPEGIDQKLKDHEIVWIWGTNFSIGMNLIRHSIRLLSSMSEILDNPQFHIHEIHHKHKVDGPSGTALSWEKWLDQNAKMTFDREGDVKGIHELSISTSDEMIHLKHEAKERSLFARGAIWAAKAIVENKARPGFHLFEDIMDQYLRSK